VIGRRKSIGIPKEIAARGKEVRVIILPREVRKLVEEGHGVLAEKGLGLKLGIKDSEYKDAGANITRNRKSIFRQDVVVKLKPPLPEEFALMKENILFAMLHAEQNPKYVKMMKRVGVKAVAMELIRNRAGERLVQCTDITGEQGMIMAYHMSVKSPNECKVLILGYGAVSTGAMRVALALGSKVKILRKSEFKYIRHFMRNADIVVNGIAWPKEKRDDKEYLVTRSMLKLMANRGIILDLSVDYPNPVETCHPTLINKPVYVVDGITHVSIFGYPVLAPISSVRKYSRQILPILLKIASVKGVDRLPSYLKQALIDPDTYGIM
jgi:alanine dehydrogenase